MINKILNKVSFKENKRRYLNLKGIATKRYAYKGPDIIQIDLTDRCDSHCLVCWIHAPSMRNDNDVNKELDFMIVKNFLHDVAQSETKEVIFSGGGEPFSYSKIWEILEVTQKAGLIFRINTNFNLLNRNDINRLLSFDNLASLTISIWAGDATLYSRLHSREVSAFYKVKDNLRFFNISKPPKLDVKIYAVINNMNYLELKSIVNLANKVGCNAVEFGVTDVLPGATDSFLLNEEQLNILRQDFIRMIEELKSKNCNVRIVNKDIFLKRISSQRACCGEYDRFADKIPCYAGWVFLRLRANGDFNSCLKSHRIPIGNIYKDDFFSVWNNPLQQDFREKSLSIDKDKEYFRHIGNGNDGTIGCKRLCDNIVMNEHLHRIVRYLFWI